MVLSYASALITRASAEDFSATAIRDKYPMHARVGAFKNAISFFGRGGEWG